jgi:hypothetical protein
MLRTARLATAAVIVTVAGIAPTAALAAKPAATNGATCSYSNGYVHGSGLPTDQVVNFTKSDASGSSAWAVGYTSDGTADVYVGTPNGAATYQYISKTWGANGSKYTVFASCTA